METEELLEGEVELVVGGEHFDLKLTIPSGPVKPQRMLPVFQSVTNQIVARGIERTEASGKSISCKAGCGACCRQPVLISEAEAFELAALVASMPEERRSIVQKRFEDGRQHFASRKWFERFDAFSKDAAGGHTKEIGQTFVALLTEFIEQRIACPFLEDESCSIYESRPLICREYLVTSPAKNCANPRPTNIEKMSISGDSSKAFASLCKTSDSSKPSSLLLIRLLEFAETHEDKFEEKIGPEWMDGFFGLLTNQKKQGLPEQKV